jgi:predicted RNase H-like HicB family nuclease
MAHGTSRIARNFQAQKGQGKTREECLANLREAIALILEHRREESRQSLPPDASQELVVVG